MKAVTVMLPILFCILYCVLANIYQRGGACVTQQDAVFIILTEDFDFVDAFDALFYCLKLPAGILLSFDNLST